MAMTTLDDAYLLRIEQMYRAILVTNDELLTLNGGYKDVSALSDAVGFNSGVLKLREKQVIFRDNEAKNLASFAELSSEELIAFDRELSLVLSQMEISLDLKKPEELVELLYGFPTEDYYSVSNKFGFIFSFLNEEQTHKLIDQYNEYTTWRFTKYDAGFVCGLIWGIGQGLVNTVAALWDLIVMIYKACEATTNFINDHILDLLNSLEEDLEWLEGAYDIAGTIAATIKDDPGIIGDFFSSIWDMLNGFIDTTVAEWVEKDCFDQGLSVGKLLGMGVFEILIAVIGTKGLDKAAKLAKSGKFVSLMEKMKLGRVNTMTDKIIDIKRMMAATKSLGALDNLALSTGSRELLTQALSKFDDAESIVSKAARFGDDLPILMNHIDDAEDAQRFLSRIDDLETDKLDEIIDIVDNIDDYPHIVMGDISRLDVEDILILKNNSPANIAEFKSILGKKSKQLTNSDLPDGYHFFDRNDGTRGISRNKGLAADNSQIGQLTVNGRDEIVLFTGNVSNRISQPGKLRALLLKDLDQRIIDLLKTEEHMHQAHHILPDEVFRNNELFKLAKKYGLGIDIDANGIMLAKDRASEIIGFSDNLPFHSGTHPVYNKLVDKTANDALALLKRNARRNGGEISKSAVLDAAEEVMETMSNYLYGNIGKLN